MGIQWEYRPGPNEFVYIGKGSGILLSVVIRDDIAGDLATLYQQTFGGPKDEERWEGYCRRLLKYLHASDDVIIAPLVAHTRSVELRREAKELDEKDALVKEVRQALQHS